jgi:sarcosine oxidase, subunit alpha
MSQDFRLPAGGRIDRSERLNFTFDGQTFTGYRGDTVASALLANGVHLVGRSFKYHRPRGIVTAGVEEPNALIDCNITAQEKGTREANNRATFTELRHGLTTKSVNAFPNLNFDIGEINSLMARFIPAGFYYKSLLVSTGMWHRVVEPVIRRAAGLGVTDEVADVSRYDGHYLHADIVIVGAGPTGLQAARVAAKSGARVVLVEQDTECGGSLLRDPVEIDGMDADLWVATVEAELAAAPNVRVLTRTTLSGIFDHNMLTALERVTDHLDVQDAADDHRPRMRWHRVRAKQVVLATGSFERPLVFRNNDLPGIMFAGAVETYLQRYGVKTGNTGLFLVNNDMALSAAIKAKDAGIDVTVVDVRSESTGPNTERLMAMGVPFLTNHTLVEAKGGKRVKAAVVAPMNGDGTAISGEMRTIECDFIGSSSGYNPIVHLHCQSGAKLDFDPTTACFVPGAPMGATPTISAGGCKGLFSLNDALASGASAAQEAMDALGLQTAEATVVSASEEAHPGSLHIRHLWLLPTDKPTSKGGKFWVDFQNDVTAADLQLAVRENFRSVEHIKRYTTLGMATDQGKTSNINALGILSDVLGVTIPDIGTTTFRPPYTPTTFGAIAGREPGDFLDVARVTPMHDWHAEHGALFEDVGQWKRAWYYPKAGENMHAAVDRECRAVRESVGILDASTLGKIIVKGPDAAEFLNRVYTNKWMKLGVGRCRYGLMLGEDGMIMDDGVSSRVAEDEFLMTTTTGGAANVLSHLEDYLQTEWTDLKVYLTSVTEQWAVASLNGPKARALLSELCDDVDLSPESFKFMEWKEATVAGIPARIFRISFTGDLAFEINVPADKGMALWTALMTAGAKYGITPYGTEAMHVLRAEKGFIIVGQDTDGSLNPHDMDMSWIIGKDKDDFIGKRSLTRKDMSDPMRKQYVGILTDDPKEVLPEGAQLVNVADAPASAAPKSPVPMQGHVSSSYWSSAAGRSIALGIVKGGIARKGETLIVPMPDGRNVKVTLTDTVFVDAEGARQHG